MPLGHFLFCSRPRNLLSSFVVAVLEEERCLKDLAALYGESRALFATFVKRLACAKPGKLDAVVDLVGGCGLDCIGNYGEICKHGNFGGGLFKLVVGVEMLGFHRDAFAVAGIL